MLTRWDRPGSIRELKDLIERAIILIKGPVLNVPLAGLWNEQGASSTLQQPIGFSESRPPDTIRLIDIQPVLDSFSIPLHSLAPEVHMCRMSSHAY